ncbi:MAG: hypothetical protein PHW52_04070 [Candidatus Pacebacteria bacterium]|nr:hypothetical protein [Candidatus Paceibacterota bacterium]
MISDGVDDRYKVSPQQALALGKLYLQQIKNGMGDVIALIPEIIRLVEKGCFTFSDVGTSPDELSALFKAGRASKQSQLEGLLVDLNVRYDSTMLKLQSISEK